MACGGSARGRRLVMRRLRAVWRVLHKCQFALPSLQRPEGQARCERRQYRVAALISPGNESGGCSVSGSCPVPTLLSSIVERVDCRSRAQKHSRDAQTYLRGPERAIVARAQQPNSPARVQRTRYFLRAHATRRGNKAHKGSGGHGSRTRGVDLVDADMVAMDGPL